MLHLTIQRDPCGLWEPCHEKGAGECSPSMGWRSSPQPRRNKILHYITLYGIVWWKGKTGHPSRFPNANLYLQKLKSGATVGPQLAQQSRGQVC